MSALIIIQGYNRWMLDSPFLSSGIQREMMGAIWENQDIANQTIANSYIKIKGHFNNEVNYWYRGLAG